MAKRNKKENKPQPKNTWEDDGFAKASNPFAALSKSQGVDSEEESVAPKAKLQTPVYAIPKRATARVQRKGRGGKTVTILSHLGISKAETLSHWASVLGKSLGCGAGVEDGEIVLQGDQRKRLYAALEKIGVERITGL